MEPNSNAPNVRNDSQLSLFHEGRTLAELSVPADSTEATVRDIGAALVTLTRYVATRTPGAVQ